MRTANIFGFLIGAPTIASICMWLLLLLNRTLLFDDTLVTLFVWVWISGTISSIIGLIYSTFLARRYSALHIGALGIVSGVGIVANVLGVLYVLGSIPRL